MKKSRHTEELLAELAAPQRKSAGDLEREVMDVLDVIEGLEDQVARFRRILQRVELTEDSMELQAQLEQFFQTVGAMEYSTSEWKRRTRELVGQFYQLNDYAERFRAIAGGLGYTINAAGENGPTE